MLLLPPVLIRWPALFSALATWVGTCVMLPAAEADLRQDLAQTEQLRQPVALALADDGRRLYVANRRSGSVSVVDTHGGRVVGELAVGRQLADLALLPNQGGLLAVDEAADELVVLERQPGPAAGEAGLRIAGRLAVSPTPVSVTVSADGRQCYVASLWSRRLSVVDLARPQGPVVVHVVDLPFAPRRQQLLADGRTLVVADSFGGRLAVVDVAEGELRLVRKLTAHNLRGLTPSRDGRSLLVPHQMLNSEKGTTHFNVHWGGVISNVVRTVPVDWLLAEEPGAPPAGDLYYLGFRDSAAGDPTALVVTDDRRQVVALAGISEVAVSDPGVNHFRQLPVGRRPTALALSPDQRHVYVANTFSDSISVIDLRSDQVEATLSLGPRPELSVADRGEMLFYDSRLSSDGWYSCHSCHTDGHSNGLLNDNLSDGDYGSPKRVLSLLGTGSTGPWAWNGQVSSLEQQIRTSVEVTMQGAPPSDEQVAALAVYLRTLAPPPSRLRVQGRLPAESVERGREVFQQQGCTSCHQPPHYTTDKAYDVGLHDQRGNRHFNPPSLRGVSQRERLFHDNRAENLEQVFTRYQHGLPEPLESQPLADLLNFLKSLE